jgi:hypothetical protein
MTVINPPSDELAHAAESLDPELAANETLPTAAEPQLPRRRHVVAIVMLVAAVRYAFSARQTMFRLTPDEFANVGMARFLAGGRWNMLIDLQTWRPGLATLLAPIYTVVHDPLWQLRSALMLNAAIAAVSVIWLIKIISRLTGAGPRLTLLLAGVIALQPSSLSASAHVWAEPLVTLTFLATLWCLLRYFEAPSLGLALQAIAWSVFGYTSHGRLLPLVGMVVLLLMGHAVMSRNLVRLAATGCAGLVGVYLSNLYSDWIVDRVWTIADRTNTTTSVLDRLDKPLQVVDSGIGQLWYQLCASALVAGVGLVVLTRRALARRADRGRVDARVVLCVVIPLMVVSMVFMSDRARGDHVIYGRYNDAIMWPVLAVGGAWLAVGWLRESRRSVAWTMGGVVVGAAELGLLLRQLHHLQLGSQGSVVIDMVAGMIPYVGVRGSIPALTTTAMALAAFAVLVGLASFGSRRPRAAACLLVVVMSAAGLRTYDRFDNITSNWGEASAVKELSPTVLDPDVPIGISIMPNGLAPDEPEWVQLTYGLLYQWYLPDHTFVMDSGIGDGVGPYVIATAHDRLLTDRGGTIVWHDPGADMAIWREPDEGDVQLPPPPADELPAAADSALSNS